MPAYEVFQSRKIRKIEVIYCSPGKPLKVSFKSQGNVLKNLRSLEKQIKISFLVFCKIICYNEDVIKAVGYKICWDSYKMMSAEYV